MDKKTSRVLYSISAALFAVIFIMGVSVVATSNFSDRIRLSPSDQTFYWLMVLAGPLGVMSCIKSIYGDTYAVWKAGIAVRIFVLACCIFWIIFLYFLSGENPDAFSQAFIWLMTAAVINGLTKQFINKGK